ncbi:MAG: methionine adenosyltransferase domain-containing protein [Planctomycetes bacterium]|nr:methionine adenosyltransferase domain-containing protein [Planctomycetota bacterium]
MSNWIVRPAEFVLPGHPDRIADAIADALVVEARQRRRRAAVAVEVAVHRNRVFIDGRIQCPGPASIDVEGIVRGLYASSGFGRAFPPVPEKLEFTTDLFLEELGEKETAARDTSEDQVIVHGYACTTPGTNFLPVEHWIAFRLARALERLRLEPPTKKLYLGPDGKLLVLVEESPDGRRFRVTDVCVSLQHAKRQDMALLWSHVAEVVRRTLEEEALRIPGLDRNVQPRFTINHGGDFIEGGPYGDNGLSGKKLVIDAYGPRVPIGGGAFAGKDLYKPDRGGAILARQAAIDIVQRHGVRECRVTLTIRRGDTHFHVAEIATSPERSLPPITLDLPLALPGDTLPRDLDLVDLARTTQFASNDLTLPRIKEAPVPISGNVEG